MAADEELEGLIAQYVGVLGERGWALSWEEAPAGELHEHSAALLEGSGPDAHFVRVLTPLGQAIVLGSTQSPAVVDVEACSAAGTSVVRRRSGGGAVLVAPRGQLWVDVVLPCSSPLWHDDVNKATWWLGDVWAAALGASGAGTAEVWKGAMQRTSLSRLVCFAGVGPGEVLGPDGRKWVGISQRRTRGGAVLQTACLLAWDAMAMAGSLVLGEEKKLAVARTLEKLAGVAPVPPVELLTNFLLTLPQV